MEKLSAQDQEFVKEVAITGNQTQAAKKAYGIKDDGYARLKGHRVITKDNINTAVAEVKKSLADRIDTDKLERVLNEGLEATKPQGVGGMAMNISKNGIDSVGHTDMFIPDYAVRHKYLDTALKIKGEYPLDNAQTPINVLMPVLVKFLENKDDKTSNNGNTQ